MIRISTLLNNEAVMTYASNLSSHIREYFFAQKYLSKLPRQAYLVLNNIILQNGDGATQIDHIVVSPFGVFVIEEKNHRANVWGPDRNTHWRSYYTYNDGQKYFAYQSPLLQNAGHINVLKHLIPSHLHKTLVSIISFTESAYIRYKGVLNSQEHIVVSEELCDLISSYRKQVLSMAEVGKIAQAILDANQQTPDNTRKHIENIRLKYSNTARPISA